MAIAVMAIAAGAAVPLALGGVDRTRASAAARYVAARMAMARLEAVKRSAFVAIRFTQDGTDYWLRTYVDGNGNGVLSGEIASDIDKPISAAEHIDNHFAGAAFGIQPAVTSLDPGQLLDPSDPIQIGASTLLSFSPNGSSTSGTIFIRGRGAAQFAVRVLGATGRTRVFEFDFGERLWRLR